MTRQQILNILPYKDPFLFVDTLDEISELGVKGSYTFKDSEFFYRGHFKDQPITPGVILTETAAQIGVVCLGIYLLQDKISKDHQLQIGLTSNTVDFFIPVHPGETITVISEKEYFRFNKLKCKVQLYNTKEQLVARGTIAGMIK